MATRHRVPHLRIVAAPSEVDDKPRQRELMGSGRFDNEGDALCVCGHVRDEHSSVRKGKPCVANELGDHPDSCTGPGLVDGVCPRFRKAKKGGGGGLADTF
jgi:hypothetical protein